MAQFIPIATKVAVDKGVPVAKKWGPRLIKLGIILVVVLIAILFLRSIFSNLKTKLKEVMGIELTKDERDRYKINRIWTTKKFPKLFKWI